MASRTCVECGRPLQEGEGEYCPHCLSKRAQKVRNASAIGGAITATITAIVGLVIVIAKKILDGKDHT